MTRVYLANYIVNSTLINTFNSLLDKFKILFCVIISIVLIEYTGYAFTRYLIKIIIIV